MARFPDTEQDIERKLREAKEQAAVYRKKTRTYLKKLWKAEDAIEDYEKKLTKMLEDKLPAY